MRKRSTGTGYRQKAWTALRRRVYPDVANLAEAIGASPNGLRPYIAVLEARGYIAREDGGGIHLVNDTGLRAPSWSVHTGDFRDWNIEPAMKASELKAVVKASGLSLSGWLAANGFDIHGATRLRQMMNGQRPVSNEIEAVIDGGKIRKKR